MSKYWVISPFKSTQPQLFDKAWEYDLKNGTIAIGWRNLIDASKMGKEELKTKIREAYPEYPKVNYTRIFNNFWSFYHEIFPGDIIIARRGRKRILAVGEVTGEPFYDENKGRERVANLTDRFCANFINVKWREKEIYFDKLVFPMFTIWKIHEEKYTSLTKGEISEEAPEEVKEQKEFILEEYLEDFIITNFNRILGNGLKLYEDDEGIGQQYPTDIGAIDILAKEPETNSYVVIELKKGRESDKVVGQILRYIGWVKENLAKEGENVKGLIICKDRDKKLDYSLKAIPDSNIEVKQYKIDFQLIE